MFLNTKKQDQIKFAYAKKRAKIGWFLLCFCNEEVLRTAVAVSKWVMENILPLWYIFHKK